MPEQISMFEYYCNTCNMHITQSQLVLHNTHKRVRKTGDSGDGLIWMIFGEFGTHKTRFLRTLPKPLLIYNFDRGLRSIKDDIKPGEIDAIDYDTDNGDDYDHAVEDIANFDYKKYQSLAIDSGPELEKLCMAKTKKLQNKEFIDLAVWNPAGERFAKLIRKLRDLKSLYGIQIVMTANEEIDREYAKGSAFESGKQPEPISIKGLADFAGKWARRAARIPDIIGRSKFYQGLPVFVFVREAVGAGGAYWETKDRTGKLENCPPVVFNNTTYSHGVLPPDWNTLWNIIAGKENKAYT